MPSTFQMQRLHRHAEYGLVYSASRRHASSSFSFFYRQRDAAPAVVDGHKLAEPGSPGDSSRVGITVPRTLGGAVLRNRIKRRLRVASRTAMELLPHRTDVVLHPRPTVASMPFPALERELGEIFRRIAGRIATGAPNMPEPRTPRSGKGGKR